MFNYLTVSIHTLILTIHEEYDIAFVKAGFLLLFSRPILLIRHLRGNILLILSQQRHLQHPLQHLSLPEPMKHELYVLLALATVTL